MVVTAVSVLVFDLDLLLSRSSRACELLDVAILLGVRGLGVLGESTNFGGGSSSSSFRAFELRRLSVLSCDSGSRARDSVGVTAVSIFGLFEKFCEMSSNLCTA